MTEQYTEKLSQTNFFAYKNQNFEGTLNFVFLFCFLFCLYFYLLSDYPFNNYFRSIGTCV